jgi:histidinol-phosphate aminotransferase
MSERDQAPGSAIQPRDTVKRLRSYVPPLEGRRERIRLDFNENTTGFPGLYPSVNSEVDLTDDEAATFLTAYPEYDRLIEALAAAWNVSPEQLLLTNGSDEALFVAAFTFIEPGADRAVTTLPTFGLIPHYLKLVGAQLVEVPYTESLQYDPAAIDPILAEGVKLAVFATPDNPVGALLPVDVIERWCAAYPETLFVIDEAYAEYSETSALPLIQRFGNLLITRTFSKAWGMAGLRLGVMLGAPGLMESLRRVRSPYSVNTFAVQTALRLLPRLEDVQTAARDTMALKARILPEVEKRGYRVIPGRANFFMIAVGPDSATFCAFFRDRGVLLRDQSGRPGLEGMVRVSIGSPAEMERFLAVLDEVKQKRVLLFDMDGTLVDTRRSFDETVAQLVEKYSGKPLGDGELDDLRREGGFNDDWESTVELLKRRGIVKTYAEIAREAQALYMTLAPETETWLIDPARLERLKTRYRLGVATGRCRTEFDPIWKERFEPLFEITLCQDDGDAWEKKPSPRLLREALSALGAEGGLYIGNSVDDMRAARAAGLMAVGVAFTHDARTLLNAGAHWVVDSLDTLEDRLMPPNAIQAGAINGNPAPRAASPGSIPQAETSLR